MILVNIKNLRDLGRKPNALRSQRVAEVAPNRVSFVEVDVRPFERAFRLARTSTEWVLLGPAGKGEDEKADAADVQKLLAGLNQLQTSEFLDPGQANDPKLDPPIIRLKIWQVGPRDALPAEPPAGPPKGEPLVNLRIGRHDTLRKTVYAQVEGDPTILALPDTVLELLPRNRLAYRDRTIQTLNVARVSHLTIERGGATLQLVGPDAPGSSVHWRLTSPVEAQADDEAVTKVLLLLGNLTAEQLVTDQPADDRTYGFDKPLVAASWTMRPAGEEANRAKEKAKGKDKARAEESTGTLRVGAKVPGGEDRYANVVGSPVVFTLGPEAVQPLLGEFHDRRVLAFPPGLVERLVLRWPDRLISFVPRDRPGGQAPEWRPEPGVDTTGLDVSKLSALVQGLSSLNADRFVQYRGIFPAAAGLEHPRLSIEVQLGGGLGAKRLRLGSQAPDGPLYATAETGAAGAVFTLAGPAWTELARTPRRPSDLPENVFKTD